MKLYQILLSCLKHKDLTMFDKSIFNNMLIYFHVIL